MDHWDERYRTTSPEERSWTEAEPSESLARIGAAGLAPDDALLDVGGGASHLVDALVERGYTDLTVLDLAASALDEARRRVAAAHPEARVAWVHADVTAWRPGRTYRLWHDRAVLHFLTGPAERDAYLATLRSATAPGSFVIVATFAPDGPPTCSGLPVARYDVAGLADALGARYALLEGARVEHTTPWGSIQPFTWTLFERRE